MAGKHNHYRDKGFSRGYVSWKQAAEVARALREKGAEIEAAAKEALKESVDLIVADAKARCPVYVDTKIKYKGKTYSYIDKRVRPGQLRDSIKATARSGGAAYTISANAKVNTRKGPLYYGQIVEFSPKINRPFLYPAFYAQEPNARERIRNAIKAALNGGA